LLAEILNFQGAKPILGMGSLSIISKSFLADVTVGLSMLQQIVNNNKRRDFSYED